jgi:CBS domain-containing membrane protein
MIRNFFERMKGREVCPPRIPFSNIIWSWFGAFIGIYIVSTLGHLTSFELLDSLFLVGSFGASAVLIYGAPHVEYAQPRNLVGGHIISAFIGVTVYKYISLDVALLGALAVSLSIVAMHFTRTLHPPGGASALIAVIGSSQVHSAGYNFVIMPVASGVILMLIVALVVNNLSGNPKRNYPRFWF